MTLLQKLLQREGELRSRPTYFFVPDTKDRIAASMQELNRLPHRNRYVLNTPEFDFVKSRLQALDNADQSGQSLPPQEQKRPALERPNR